MFGSWKNKAYLTVSKTCFALVAFGAALSLVGFVDAVLAVDLLVFDVLSKLHAAVVGLVVSLIAAVGIAGTILTSRNDDRRTEHAQPRVPLVPTVNLRLNAERVQAMLHVLQYPIKIDGVFGPATEDMIREFQEDANLQVDGVAGALTLEALQMQVETIGRTGWVSDILAHDGSPGVPASTAPMLTLISAHGSEYS